MGQQDSNFVDNYAASLANGTENQEPQNDPPMPLPGTDTLKSHGSGDNNGTTDSGGEQSVNYKDLGQTATTHDIQQAHGNGWTYDPDAMLKQIKHLEDLRDKKMWKMKQSAEGVVDISPPAGDKVSNNFVEIANKSGQSHNEQFEKYQQ